MEHPWVSAPLWPKNFVPGEWGHFTKGIWSMAWEGALLQQGREISKTLPPSSASKSRGRRFPTHRRALSDPTHSVVAAAWAGPPCPPWYCYRLLKWHWERVAVRGVALLFELDTWKVWSRRRFWLFMGHSPVSCEHFQRCRESKPF